jgi:hypothetical protein
VCRMHERFRFEGPLRDVCDMMALYLYGLYNHLQENLIKLAICLLNVSAVSD